MATPETESAAKPKVVFRAGKKRKAYRQRAEDEIDEKNTATDDGTPAAPPTMDVTSENEDEKGLSVAEALRLRNARKHKLGGVGFRAGQSSNNESATANYTEQGMVLHDGADGQLVTDIIGGVNTRFAPQTGLVGEIVNKHMEEYVESELARRKRHAAEASAREEEQAKKSASAFNTQLESATTGLIPQVVDSQRVLQGKLMEIDLGDDARARNIEMTERARRRLQGQIDEDEESGDGRQKVRIGRDGKPWRPRNRRNSDDIKRDQLVEAFLSENKLDMYDVTSKQAAAAAAPDEDDEYAADDRIAEEFRRDFMDAMAQRNRRRRRPATNAKQAAKLREDILKGPKLGGSRNARAAARDVLLKEQQSKRR
ncbi:hepatocellular carcinoma-associated antigen 59-domain-containing protein [Cladorrhinum sp. PSN332]|nr:hepatocellular carcinoma-associated antigen 59-domain-containing protein [Cladorrhinum sp. PSN332]